MKLAQVISLVGWPKLLNLVFLLLLLQVYTGKLSLVDLAGSERASETNNVGRQLKDGANINRCGVLSHLHLHD